LTADSQNCLTRMRNSAPIADQSTSTSPNRIQTRTHVRRTPRLP
jgi:hypothetical protein